MFQHPDAPVSLCIFPGALEHKTVCFRPVGNDDLSLTLGVGNRNGVSFQFHGSCDILLYN